MQEIRSKIWRGSLAIDIDERGMEGVLRIQLSLMSKEFMNDKGITNRHGSRMKSVKDKGSITWIIIECKRQRNEYMSEARVWSGECKDCV